jgi:hypothetical protein
MRARLLGLAAAGAILCAAPASAQVESVTVSLLPGSVTFALTTGSATNAASQTIAATTSWTVLPLRNNISLFAYFTSAAAALAHVSAANTIDIPSSRVEVSINGAANVPFNQTVAFGGAAAGVQIFSQSINAVQAVGNRTDNLLLNINLSGYVLPADTYQGTLRLRARATP